MSEIVKYIQGLAQNNDKKTIRKILHTKGVLSSYSPDDGRIICYTSKNDRFKKQSTPFWGECNGLIYDIEQQKTLVAPPYNYKTHVHVQSVNKDIADGLYEIHKINDGTIINLYYYMPDGKWEISTTRGYKMLHQTWDALTYREMIETALKKTCDISFDELCEKLDQNICYTFGFKHPNIHPFKEGNSDDPYNFWFVQAQNPETRQRHNLPRISIPKQKKVDGITDVKVLFNILKRSLSMFLSTGQINYGFILTRKDKTDKNILLESSLMQKIRQMVYNKKVRFYFQQEYSPKLRAVVNYFNVNTKALYISLFPQDLPVYAEIDNLMEKTIVDVMAKKNKQAQSGEIPEWFILHVYDYANNVIGENFDANYIKALIYTPTYVSMFHSLIQPNKGEVFESA